MKMNFNTESFNVKSIKKFSTLLLVGCILLGLAACGGEQEISAVSLQGKLSEDQIYYATDLELQLSSNEAGVDFKVYGSTIYYPEGQAVETYSTTDRKTTTDTYTWSDAPGSWVFEKICYSGSGELYGLVSIGGGEVSGADATTSTLYLCKFDAERNLVFAENLAEYYQKNGAYTTGNSGLEVGTDAKVYLRNNDVIWIFDGNGSYKGEVSLGNMEDITVLDFVGDAYRELYVLYENIADQTQYVAGIDTETGRVTKVQQTIGLTGLDATDSSLLAYNGAVVYRYDREAASLTELFHWSECNVNGSNVYGVFSMLDGSIFVAGNVQGGMKNYLVKSLMIERVSGSQTGKTDIRIAVFGSGNRMLSHGVTKFNSNNEQYNVILENYAEDGRDAAWARLSAELAAGVGPDLIDLSSVSNVESLVEDGHLEDLEVYLEENETMSTGDFLETALEAYRVNGVLAAIPQHFVVQVLIGNSDYVGEERGWNLEEMLDFMEPYQGQRVFADEVRRDVFLSYMLWMNEASFVDRASGTCDFDNETFRRIAELAEVYPVEIASELERKGEPSEYTNLKNMNGFLCYVPLIDFRGLQVYEDALEGNLTCIGFPDEEQSGVIASYEDALAINASSKNKAGAWAFLEDYLQRTGASTMGYFPTYRPSLEVIGKDAKFGYHRTQVYGTDSYRIDPRRMTEEEMTEIYNLLEAARPADIDDTLIDILMEELEGYYDGEITLDAAIENIEKQVLIYLAE